jgi:hypothetical protein
MALHHSPRIVTSGLVLALDAGDVNSYLGSGTAWKDLSGNGKNVTLYNTPGYAAGEFTFDGTSDYASTTLTGVNFDSSGFTLEQYVMLLNEPGAWRTTFNIKNASNVVHIDIRNTNGAGAMNMNYYPAAPDIATATYTIAENTWHHLVGTWDGTTLRFFVDGVERGSAALASLALGTSPIFTIGRAYDTTRYVNNKFASIRVYTRALSATEIEQNYAAQRSRFNL